jgi:hypothetical protein
MMEAATTLLSINALKWEQSCEGFVAAASELGAPIEAQAMDLAGLPGDALRLYIVCKKGAG